MMFSPRIGRRKDLLFDEWLLETPLPSINAKTPIKVFAYTARDLVSGGVWPARTGTGMIASGAGCSRHSLLRDGADSSGPPYGASGGSNNCAKASVNFAYPGTKDYIVEGLACSATNDYWGNQQMFAGAVNAAGSAYWELEFVGASAPAAKLRHYMGPPGALITVDSAVVIPGAMIHFALSVNRDEASANGARWIVDGALSGSGVDLSPNSASLTFDSELRLGGGDNPAIYPPGMQGRLVMVQAWMLDDLIAAGAAGQNEVAAIMLARTSMST